MTEINPSNINSEIISKIAKVLALANNNPSVEEGQTAMLLAQKMMFENNISVSDISFESPKKEVVNQTVIESKRSFWWNSNLAAIISKNFKCGTYISRSHKLGITSIKFVGLKNDVEIAKQTLLYAIEVVSYNCKKYVMSENKTRVTTKGMKNQYILGFLDGLRDKFEEQIKNNNWGLVLVKDPLVTDAMNKLKLRNGGRLNIHTNGNEQDRLNGYKDGKNFNVISGNLT